MKNVKIPKGRECRVLVRHPKRDNVWLPHSFSLTSERPVFGFRSFLQADEAIRRAREEGVLSRQHQVEILPPPELDDAEQQAREIIGLMRERGVSFGTTARSMLDDERLVYEIWLELCSEILAARHRGSE